MPFIEEDVDLKCYAIRTADRVVAATEHVVRLPLLVEHAQRAAITLILSLSNDDDVEAAPAACARRLGMAHFCAHELLAVLELLVRRAAIGEEIGRALHADLEHLVRLLRSLGRRLDPGLDSDLDAAFDPELDPGLE